MLSDLNMKRKNIEESDIEDICFAMIEELESCGYNLGYRALHSKLKKKYHLKITRDTVYHLLKMIDPDGVANRKAHRLHRREYLSPGPNFIWHLDGYDKLKPYGFSIHGCIDGFSRYILWLEVGSTNKDPDVIAYYFLETVKKFKCVPSIIRADNGSENVVIESLQIALRKYDDDKFSADRSYIKGKSVHKQRIESFWGQLRKHCVDFLINFFKCLVEKDLFNGSTIHKLCLQYAFGPYIKKQIKLFKNLWNEHYIRKQNNKNNICGKPCIMYNLPEKYNAVDYKKNLDEDTINELIEKVTKKPYLVDTSFKNEVEKKITPKKVNNIEDALDLYMQLLHLFE